MNQPHQPGKNFLPGIYKIIKNASAEIPHASDNCIIICFADINGNLETDLAKRLIKRWAKTKSDFRQWYSNQTNFKLGKILTSQVQTDTEIIFLLVLNEGVLDLNALKDAMISAGRYAIADKKNIHINKTDIEWPAIEGMLREYFVKSGVNVSVYEGV
jgi:hypothetical protein